MEGPVDSIRVALYRDGLPTGAIKELKKANGWTATFENLAMYESMANTKNYEYTIKEVDENDQAVEDRNGISVVDKTYVEIGRGHMNAGIKEKNKEEVEPTHPAQPTRNVKVTKEWKSKDGNIMEGPVDSIRVALYRDGLPNGTINVLKKANGWTAIFENLAMYESMANTKNYEYTIKEVDENDQAV